MHIEYEQILPKNILIDASERFKHLLQSRQKNPNPPPEFMIMSYLPGDNLGQFWEELSWEERKV